MKEIVINKHCFGETILIDGVDIKDVNKEEILRWMFTTVRNMEEYEFIEAFKTIAWTVYSDHENVYSSSCDQCGDWNSEDILKFEEK